MLLQVSRDWLTAPEPPAGLAVHQELFGYVWLALACDPSSGGTIRPENARAGLGDMRDLPLLQFKFATACDRRNPEALGEVLTPQGREVLEPLLAGAAVEGQAHQIV